MGRARLPLLASLACALGACTLLYNGNDLHGKGGAPDAGTDLSAAPDDLLGLDLAGADLTQSGGPDLAPVTLGLRKAPVLIVDNALAIAAADLNDDGKDELLVLTDGNQLKIFFYDSATGFSVDPQLTYATCSNPEGLAVAHLVGTDRMTIVIGCSDNKKLVGLTVQTSTADSVTFAPPGEIAVGGTGPIAVADLDNDGLDDLVICESHARATSDYYLDVVYGDASAPTVQDKLIGSDGALTEPRFVQLDATGAPELVGLIDQALLSLSAPGFDRVLSADLSLDHTGYGLATLVSGGQAIAVVGINEAPLAQAQAFTTTKVPFTSAGKGLPIDVSPAPIAMLATDIDNDGQREIIVGTYDYTQPTIVAALDVLAVSGKTLTLKKTMPLDRVPGQLVPGDFDGDKKTDLVVASFNNASTVDVWLSSP